MPELTIAITSVGRRLYIVEWFKAAMQELGVVGRIVVADGDPQAPGLTAGDSSAILPPFTDEDYADALVELCSTERVGLLISLNDYEASVIAATAGTRLEAAGTIVTGLGPSFARFAVDKWASALELSTRGIPVPSTSLGSDFLDRGQDQLGAEVVVKHRFGSGSSGLLFGDVADTCELIAASARTAPDESGRISLDPGRNDLVIVQARIRGDEFGVDVLSDLDGNFVTAFARKKLRMRAGETDRALTVDAQPFLSLASAVSGAMRPRGLVDMDVLVDEAGVAHLIDLNPRFGGGYPFSHIAGADAPACYVAWAAGLPIRDQWLAPTAGVAGSKYEAITVVPALTSSGLDQRSARNRTPEAHP